MKTLKDRYKNFLENEKKEEGNKTAPKEEIKNPIKRVEPTLDTEKKGKIFDRMEDGQPKKKVKPDVAPKHKNSGEIKEGDDKEKKGLKQ